MRTREAAATISQLREEVERLKSGGAYGDPYQGAREDLSIWKLRALEAEGDIRIERGALQLSAKRVKQLTESHDDLSAALVAGIELHNDLEKTAEFFEGANEKLTGVCNDLIAENEQLRAQVEALKNPNRCPNCHLAYTDDSAKVETPK